MNNIDVSVIIPCKNEINNLKSTIDSILKSESSLKIEIIIVDDGSSDESTKFLNSSLYKNISTNIRVLKCVDAGCAGAKNLGAKHANGAYLFFCDAHVCINDKCLDSLIDSLKKENAHLCAPCISDMNNPDSKGYGETWDKNLNLKWITKKPDKTKEIPIACGCAFCIERKVFEHVEGFNHFFQIWGKEDEEISLKLWLYGYKVIVNPHIVVSHLFRTSFPYNVISSNVLFNLLSLAYCHFNKKRLIKTIQLNLDNPSFTEVSSNLKKCSPEILASREFNFNERKFSDDFFFSKFNIPF